jgi:hypothetical protein
MKQGCSPLDRQFRSTENWDIMGHYNVHLVQKAAMLNLPSITTNIRAVAMFVIFNAYKIFYARF